MTACHIVQVFEKRLAFLLNKLASAIV